MSILGSSWNSSSDWLWNNLRVAFHSIQGRLDEMTGPLFVSLVIAIMLLETRFPANPAQKRLGVSVLQDMVWFLFQAVGSATILAAYAVFLTRLYETWLGFLSIEVVEGLPRWLQLIVAVVLIDFLRYAQHILQHKVPWFWQFHALHHSQRHLNLFTDFRYHYFEYIVRETVLFVPLLMLGLHWPSIVWLTLLFLWHARFYHSNIKWNLGVLRFVIVTPQSHRIHHSVEPAHQDQNYGAFFSIWDWLFGTQYPGADEYPTTGIADQDFPHERFAGGLNLILTPIRQMVYPFVAIGKRLLSQSDNS